MSEIHVRPLPAANTHIATDPGGSVADFAAGKRVLFVTPNLHRPFGGPPVTIFKMIDAVHTFGADVEVAYAGHSASDADADITRLKQMGVKFYRFHDGSINALCLRWGISPSLISFVLRRAKSYDLISLHQIWGTQILYHLSRTVRERSVLIPHESLTRFDVERPQATKLAKRIQMRLVSRFNFKILFSSHLEKNDSVSYGASSISTVAYHPINFTSRLPTKSDIATFTIGYIGRLHHKKNVDKILLAMADIPEIKLHVAGDGGDRGKLQRLAQKLSIEDRIQWFGFIGDADKDQFFSTLDACLVPSEYECFGQSAVEAMTSGVPLICTETVGAAEGLTDGISCIRCTPEPASISRAIQVVRAMTPDERLAIAENARKYAEETFSPAAFAEALVQLGLGSPIAYARSENT